MNSQNVVLPQHSFNVKDRSGIFVTGVAEVLSFDDASIVLKTSAGGMAIEGNALKISRLSVENGELCADGRINSVYYFSTEKKDKAGLISRLFK